MNDIQKLIDSIEKDCLFLRQQEEGYDTIILETEAKLRKILPKNFSFRILGKSGTPEGSKEVMSLNIFWGVKNTENMISSFFCIYDHEGKKSTYNLIDADLRVKNIFLESKEWEMVLKELHKTITDIKTLWDYEDCLTSQPCKEQEGN